MGLEYGFIDTFDWWDERSGSGLYYKRCIESLVSRHGSNTLNN